MQKSLLMSRSTISNPFDYVAPLSIREKSGLIDSYRFPGFSPETTVTGIFGDPKARVVRLKRTGEKPSVGPVGQSITAITTRKSNASATCRAATQKCISSLRSDASSARPAAM